MAKATEASVLNWNVAELVDRNDKNEIDFNVPIQRGYVWDSKRASLLIHSILIGLPISIFFFNKVGKKYEGLEGKQRNKAIYDYVKGRYKLHGNTPTVEYEDQTYNIARKTFNQLPELLQNKILRYGLIIQWFDNATIDDKILIFTRINSGKPVTASEIARLKVKSRDTFLSLIKHPAIVNIVSERNKGRCIDEDIVEDIWYITYIENPNLLNKYRAPILAETEVSNEQKNEIINALDYMHALFVEAKKNKRIYAKFNAKIHVVSLGYMAIKAIQNNINKEDYIKKALAFFNGEGRKPTNNEAYNQASLSGTSRQDQVSIRINELEKALKK